MADDNYNIIKPVEGLQNIGGLTPVKGRKERKRRQNLHKKNEKEYEPAEDKSNEPIEKDVGREITENDRDQHTIDYRA